MTMWTSVGMDERRLKVEHGTRDRKVISDSDKEFNPRVALDPKSKTF